MPLVRWSSVLVLVLLCCYGRAAGATGVSINPVRIHLSVSQRSELLEISNAGLEPARFQAKAYAWHETVDGQLMLTPTRDLLFFPSLVEIPVGKTRRIRIASTVRPGAVERSYRLILEEFPRSPVPGTVQVLTRLSIPVFVQPSTPQPAAQVKAELAGGQLVIWLANGGNAYFKADSVRVVARSATGDVVFEHSLAGWYVLAAGERRYDVPLPPGVCQQIANLHTSLRSEQGNVSRRNTPAPGKACGG